MRMEMKAMNLKVEYNSIIRFCKGKVLSYKLKINKLKNCEKFIDMIELKLIYI